MPKLSILMRIQNTELHRLCAAIDSVLAQTFADFEFIILNDSIENTELDKIIAKCTDSRIKYIKNDSYIGMAQSINKLLSIANGEYIAIQEPDDISLPDRFQEQVSYLDTHIHIGVIGTQAYFPDTGLRTFYPTENSELKRIFTTDNYAYIIHASCMFRKSLFLDNNIYYEPEFFPDEYNRLFSRLMEHTQFNNSDKILIENFSRERPLEKHNNQILIRPEFSPILQSEFYEFMVKIEQQDCEKLFFIDFDAHHGGTAIHFNNVLPEINKVGFLFHIKFNPITELFKITVYKNQQVLKHIVCDSFEEIIMMMRPITANKIIINNICYYPNPHTVLNFVKENKNNARVTAYNHNFLFLCPNVVLCHNDRDYCGAPNDTSVCQSICPYISGITEHRSMWRDFLKNVADEIIVFSQSSKEILLRLYPELCEKITVTPHQITNIRPVNIAAHNEINIAIIGDCKYGYKGYHKIIEMASILPNDVNIVCIGTDTEMPENIRHIRNYRLSQLPDIIEENKIDIVFIPSTWPETFSYTTGEAIHMGLPVACFNLGGQADQVKKYDNGLIISKIDASSALTEMINFIKSIRTNH